MEHITKVKHMIRDTAIWLFTISGVTARYRRRVKSKGPLVRVVAFHDVANRAWFEGVIAMLAGEFNVITPEQFHKKEFAPEKINILITFDDGYQSWVDNCLPILKKFNIKAIFFIISGLVDIADDQTKVDAFMHDRLLISSKKALAWDGVRKLAAEGHSIGGHTRSHVDLATLDREEIQREIKDDKTKIESELTAKIVDFAYPFGRTVNYDPEVMKMVRDAGYGNAFTAESAFSTQTANNFEIPRTLIEKEQLVSLIRSWILGGYDVFLLVSSH